MNLSTLYEKLTNWKYIIWLLILFIWIINFCSADFIWSFTCTDSDTTCWKIKAPNDCVNSFSVYFDWWGKPFTVYRNWWNSAYLEYYSWLVTSDCSYIEISWAPWFISTTYPFNVNYWSDPNWWNCPDCPTCPSCPEINTWEILSWYILESEIDTNYCVWNWLCPNECWSGEEITGTNRSSLYINNIQYPWAPTIRFTIPEEIEREQNTDEEETNIDVIWYGYDQDKMQQMVNTQHYKPTAEEMSWLIGKVADFLPLVAIALLITRIRRVIKKVF